MKSTLSHQKNGFISVMRDYNLDFISNEDLLKHVKDTVEKYRFEIDLKSFNANLVDPIKFTFDSKVYNRDIKQVIEHEIARQIDKSNTNHIGYFHQNIFKYIGNDWKVPDKGYDVINENLSYYVEIKNKHNTMNSSSSQKTYMRMQNKILENDESTCMLVEVISKSSQNIKWIISIDGRQMSHKNIRRVSIDKFYELVTGDKIAFKKLCEILPQVIEDAIADTSVTEAKNTVLCELEGISPNILQSLYLLSFKKYEGFESFNVTE